ncbi:cellulase family glycosylhydrolase [Archangium violaceum]|uniref:glycoside hydrolase family 5 protein n=1 Tax=Archangium violaceum TaxID=83451 RepID=UPI0019510F5C|nr:cellulase family glycosylhydrolase [Archangium violaceum]QRN95870.1 cellulase family glycosylhydrolase [Archangium violaceum]
MFKHLKMMSLLPWILCACGGSEPEVQVVQEEPAADARDGGSESPTVANPTGRFYIVGKDIVDPSGNKFYPVGANLDGWDFFQRDTENRAAAAANWGWNIIRINGAQLAHPDWKTYGLVSGDLSKPNFDKIDRIVQAYTSRKIVVLIEFHDGVWANGGVDATRLAQTRSAWIALANKYKTNTFVWFNLLNEPVWSQPVSEYLSVHTDLRDAIRSTGAENIIVMDGGVAGQEWPGWGIPGNLIPTYGPQLSQNQCNILFSIHVYNAWAEAGGSSPHTSQFIAYLNSVQSKNLALIVGETGWNSNDSDVPRLKAGSMIAFTNAPAYGVGIIAWHGNPNWGDTFALTKADSSGQFYSIDNWTQPTTLTDFGKVLWDLSHKKPVLGAFTGSYAASGCASAK